MKRIILIALTICGLLLLVCAAFVLLGHYQLDEVPIAGLAQCGVHPCMLNVTLDQTSWQDAVSRLKDRPDVTISDNSITILPDKFTRVRFEASESNATISLFDLDFLGTQRPTLGSIINHYGMPCRVVAYSASSITLFYPHSLVYVRGEDLGASVPVLRPEARIGGFNIETVDNSCNSYDGSYVQWHGFASIERYLASQ